MVGLPMACHSLPERHLVKWEGGHSGIKWLPIAKQSAQRSSGYTNIGADNSFEGKKGGSQLQIKKLIRVVTCKMCLFSPCFV